jgi:hypothetical protein
MFNADLSGLNRLIAQLEQRSLDYQNAIDEAVKYAQQTIKARVKLGQLTDGSYRVSNNPFGGSRYSERQFRFRKSQSPSLPTGIHNLYVSGNLDRNFVIGSGTSPNKANKLYTRSLGFTNTMVSGKKITYAELAQIQEAKTGIGFQLSPSQLIRVMARFKQVARL